MIDKPADDDENEAQKTPDERVDFMREKISAMTAEKRKDMLGVALGRTAFMRAYLPPITRGAWQSMPADLQCVLAIKMYKTVDALTVDIALLAGLLSTFDRDLVRDGLQSADERMAEVEREVAPVHDLVGSLRELIEGMLRHARGDGDGEFPH